MSLLNSVQAHRMSPFLPLSVLLLFQPVYSELRSVSCVWFSGARQPLSTLRPLQRSLIHLLHFPAPRS